MGRPLQPPTNEPQFSADRFMLAILHDLFRHINSKLASHLSEVQERVHVVDCISYYVLNKSLDRITMYQNDFTHSSVNTFSRAFI